MSLSTDNVILTMIGDEDHRVRSAVASCLGCLVISWTTTKTSPSVARAKCLESDLCSSIPQEQTVYTFCGVPVPINGMADSYRDVLSNENIVDNLGYFIDEIFRLLVSSNSKFVKVIISDVHFSKDPGYNTFLS